MIILRNKFLRSFFVCLLISGLIITDNSYIFAAETQETEIAEDTELSEDKYQEDYDIMSENELNSRNISISSIDEMLLLSQQWLNDNFRNETGYVEVPEDGTSRRATIDSLLRALQIELGITATAPSFGPTTTTRFNAAYPNGVIQQTDGATEESRVYGIIQCALWVKGYVVSYGGITKHFYASTGDAVINLKQDMGFQTPNSTVTLNVMKGLLSMDQYVQLSSGNDQIRLIQQSLNRKYESYIGLIPCDGIYGRQMNIAMIKVLQAIEGYTPTEATGNFGSGTKSRLPILPDTGGLLNPVKEQEAILLIRSALCVNGYYIDYDIPYWDDVVNGIITEFQQDMALPVTGNADVDTWMSLLTSNGNTDRQSIACDTRFEMTQERLDYLKANGYQIVGRYLTGTEKGLKDDEPQRILNNGISFFPIFQETLYSDTISKYNYNLGVSDAQKATDRASELGIPYDTIIYFAIDFDPQDWDIQNYVIPYFQALSENMGDYRVGIYGTRNTCTQIMALSYAETSFVSDMSTGYSGNMGFKMPNNWNLDQFYEYTVTTASGSWNIDKVAYSNKFPVVSSNIKIIPPNSTDYLWGNVEFFHENTGDFFLINGDKFRYRIVWECPEGNDDYHYLNTYLEKYNIGTVWSEEWHYGQFEYQTEWMPVEDKARYRLTYHAHNILFDLPLSAKVTVYFDTAYDE